MNSVQYNLYNKKILDKFPYPYTTSLIQVHRGNIFFKNERKSVVF